MTLTVCLTVFPLVLVLSARVSQRYLDSLKGILNRKDDRLKLLAISEDLFNEFNKNSK